MRIAETHHILELVIASEDLDVDYCLLQDQTVLTFVRNSEIRTGGVYESDGSLCTPQDDGLDADHLVNDLRRGTDSKQ